MFYRLREGKSESKKQLCKISEHGEHVLGLLPLGDCRRGDRFAQISN